MDVPYFTDQKAFAFEQQNMTRVGGSVDSLAGRRMVILCSGVLARVWLYYVLGHDNVVC